MPQDFVLISKRSPKVKAVYNDLMSLLSDVRHDLEAYTFQHQIVGSFKRNLITYDQKSNIGFDLDVNIYPNDPEEELTAKEIKLGFKASLDIFARRYGFDYAEDSTRVLTIKVKDRSRSCIQHSVDFAFVYDYEEKGRPRQQYIRFQKGQNNYYWAKQSRGYYKLPEREQWIKKQHLWDEFCEYYIYKKNVNPNPRLHSRSIFASAAKEFCEQNGYRI